MRIQFSADHHGRVTPAPILTTSPTSYILEEAKNPSPPESSASVFRGQVIPGGSHAGFGRPWRLMSAQHATRDTQTHGRIHSVGRHDTSSTSHSFEKKKKKNRIQIQRCGQDTVVATKLYMVRYTDTTASRESAGDSPVQEGC